MTKYPRAATASRRGGFTEQRTVHYVADHTWYSPVPDAPWASHVHGVTCTHKHKTPEGAQRCGERMVRAAVAEFQANAEATYPATPCDRQVAKEADLYDGCHDGYLAYCAAHRTAAVTWHRYQQDAEQDGWKCPWEEVVRVTV
jgi:hypothetical protein